MKQFCFTNILNEQQLKRNPDTASQETQKKHAQETENTLPRDSKAILQISPQSLVARETTGKDFLILRHFSLWVVGRDRIDSISDKYEDHIC